MYPYLHPLIILTESKMTVNKTVLFLLIILFHVAMEQSIVLFNNINIFLL